ncbi:MAG: pseudouridine synthase, partial [Clostridia bacterium]|nr:pseudouridine synthase [Clostridia bacterium]
MIDETVPNGVRDMPVAKYLLRAYPLLPGWVAREALKKRDVRVNGEKVTAANVSAGDRVMAYVPDRYTGGKLDIIYHKDGLLVIDKPPALPVDVDALGIGSDTVLTRARAIEPNARLCHRLDAGTGGVLLLATDDEAYEKAVEAFKNHEIKKIYELIVKGRPPVSGTLVHYLHKDAKTALVRAYDSPAPGRVEARLNYRSVESSGDSSKVEAEI